MSAAFDALGINLPTLIAFVVNFGLLLFLLRTFLWRPVLRQLSDRRERIQSALNAAEAAAQQAQQSEARVQEQIRQAQIEGQQIVANAQQIAERIREDANREAQQRIESSLTQAEAQIRLETEAARASLRREFADLTILAAEKVISQSLDKQQHLRLINDVLAQSGNGAA